MPGILETRCRVFICQSLLNSEECLSKKNAQIPTPMLAQVEILTLHPRHVFRISRGAKPDVENVILRVQADGCEGIGEASPNAFYRESARDVAQRLHAIIPWLREIQIRTYGDIIELWPQIWRKVGPSRAAVCAIDLALWDFLGQRMRKSLCEMVWEQQIKPVLSCATLGLSEPEEAEIKLNEIKDFPLIKIKASANGPVELVRWIRERTPARLLIDANASWDSSTLMNNAPILTEIGVELIEQPLRTDTKLTIGQCKFLRSVAIPIFADESCVIPEDIARLPDWYHGFNIKLVKCGGLTPALEMLRLGRDRGLKIMTGGRGCNRAKNRMRRSRRLLAP